MIQIMKDIINWDVFSIRIGYGAIVGIIVMLAMIIDFILGVMKAKKRNELRTSTGFRLSVTKIIRYISLIALMFLLDSAIYIGRDIDFLKYLSVAPIFTILTGIGLVCIEIKSYVEKADEKTKKDLRTVSDIIVQKEDLTKAIANAISDTLKRTENENK